MEIHSSQVHIGFGSDGAEGSGLKSVTCEEAFGRIEDAVLRITRLG
jgi:hypothetical protein